MNALPKAIKIAPLHDYFLPNFEFRLEGRPLEKQVVRDVLQVTFSDSLQEIPGFQLTINNWDVDSHSTKYSDSDLFDPGKKCELWMGYRDQGGLQCMLRGVIKTLSLSYPAGGGPTLSVTGLNQLDRGRQTKRSEKYEKLTDSQIAKKNLGPRLGVPVDTDPKAEKLESQHEYLLQENIDDLRFLFDRAEALDYVVLVREPRTPPSRLYFGPKEGLAAEPLELVYGKTLSHFSAVLNTANQVHSVKVQSTDPKSRKPITATATFRDLDMKPLNDAGRLDRLVASFQSQTDTAVKPPPKTQAEADRQALGRLRKIARQLVTASGGTVGLPELRAGSFVEIDLGRSDFDGHYFVTNTTHTIGSGGYTTEFQCRR